MVWRAPLLRSADALRAVRPDALHVTLCFLGWKREESIEPLGELVQACAAGIGSVAGLALGEALWLPRGRPRVLALALEDRRAELAELQARLTERLAADDWYEPETRPYLPHVTVARVRGGASASRGVALPPVPALSFAGAAVTLYRSRLERTGARYEPLFVGELA